MDKYEGHTPGPWEYRGQRCPILSPQGKPVPMHVVATNHPNGQWDEIYVHTEATALLIADAPMLAEQNAKMLAMMKEEIRLGHSTSDKYCKCPDCKNAIAIKQLISEIEATS